MNKRGFELAVGTLVVMILAVVVLLVLVSFFMMGSGNFLDNIKGYFSYTNVDSVVQSCNVLADSGSVNAFCCDVKEVKYVENGEKKEGEFSCDELVSKDFTDGKIDDISCSVRCGNLVLNEESCENSGGRWNSCGNRCEIMGAGKDDVFCTQMCEEICECGTIAGLSCPSGYECIMPEGVADAGGYCE